MWYKNVLVVREIVANPCIYTTNYSSYKTTNRHATITINKIPNIANNI